MKLNIQKRENHAELMKNEEDTTYKIYNGWYTENKKIAEVLEQNLKDIEGNIIMRKDSHDSWGDYEVFVEYKDVEINVRENWRGNGKLNFFGYNKLQNTHIPDYPIKHPNYTKIDTCNPKKILAWINWVVNRYNYVSEKHAEIENDLQSNVMKKKAVLQEIADYFGVKVKSQEIHYNRSNEMYVDIPTKPYTKRFSFNYGNVGKYVSQEHQHIGPDELLSILRLTKQ